MSDGKFILIGAGVALVVGIAIYYGAKKLGSGISAAIPQVVKDGAEAAGQLGGLGVNIVTNPLDAFGVSPKTDTNGAAAWTPTTPQSNVNDPVSNNDSGMNFNLF